MKLKKLAAALHRMKAATVAKYTKLQLKRRRAAKQIGKHCIGSHSESEYFGSMFERIFGIEDSQKIYAARSAHRTNGFLTVPMILERLGAEA